jgi:signal transduction histidine kinase
VLENEGLQAALGEAAAGCPIPTRVESDGTGRYPAELEAAVYFCCLEALQNAAKHAGAGARATVTIGEHNGTLAFSVADTGQGFDLEAVGPSAGIMNMTDRIGALGGRLNISSTPPVGTTVSGVVPL